MYDDIKAYIEGKVGSEYEAASEFIVLGQKMVTAANNGQSKNRELLENAIKEVDDSYLRYAKIPLESYSRGEDFDDNFFFKVRGTYRNIQSELTEKVCKLAKEDRYRKTG